jgi:cytochrome c
MLASKIIKGGQGVWGAIPMTPHSSLSEADAEQMVKYILLLKK